MTANSGEHTGARPIPLAGRVPRGERSEPQTVSWEAGVWSQRGWAAGRRPLESASAGGGVASFSREAGASPRGNQRSPRYCNWMSNENVQAVREVIDAFNRRD